MLKRISIAAFFAALSIGIVSLPATAQEQAALSAPPPAAAGTDEGYQLGTGDKVHVNVFDEDELSGEFAVDGSGLVRLPLIGQVQAKGLTVRQFENEIIAKLSDGYLKSPRVSVEVTTYRPFYIIGEVNKPGEYPYVSGMNAVNAIALAGGYTYRASDSVVYVRRKGSSTEEKEPADETTPIEPGDIVRVPERFF